MVTQVELHYGFQGSSVVKAGLRTLIQHIFALLMREILFKLSLLHSSLIHLHAVLCESSVSGGCLVSYSAILNITHFDGKNNEYSYM